MRPRRTIRALTGLFAIAFFAAGCGAARQTTSTAVTPKARPRARIAKAPPRAHVVILAPARTASTRSTVQARVKVTGRGHLRFILDGGRPRLAAGWSITYRNLAPGRHRLVAQLLTTPEQAAVATATVHFSVRHPPAPPSPQQSPVLSPTTSAPPPAPAAPASTTAPAPVPTVAPAPTQPPTSPPPAAHPPAGGGGIPQGGGGDGDGDNSGGPSDGDGNL